jgi:hypothetical protein
MEPKQSVCFSYNASASIKIHLCFTHYAVSVLKKPVLLLDESVQKQLVLLMKLTDLNCVADPGCLSPIPDSGS